MKTNITLKIEASLLREARVLAAREGTSISALLAGRLKQIVRESKTWERAHRRAITRLRQGFDLGFARPRSRDELHEKVNVFADSRSRELNIRAGFFSESIRTFISVNQC